MMLPPRGRRGCQSSKGKQTSEQINTEMCPGKHKRFRCHEPLRKTQILHQGVLEGQQGVQRGDSSRMKV